MHIFRCRSKCNKSHNNCDRGVLPSDFAYCHTAGAALVDSTITFVTFESTEVETFGKGTPYTRMDKIENEMELSEFLLSLKKEFIEFAHHIVAAWFLRSTKLEVFSVSQRRASVLTIVSDFGEAYLVESKHETSTNSSKERKSIFMALLVTSWYPRLRIRRLLRSTVFHSSSAVIASM